MVSTVFLFVFLLALIVVVGTAAIGAWKAAPWVPTRLHDVRRMLDLAGVKPGETVVDLGSGDGRFLSVAVRSYGARGIGYELSLLPYLASLVVLWGPLRKKRVAVHYADFFRADLSQADVITIFLTPNAMKKLSEKFTRELKPGCRVVSFAFSWPGRIPAEVNKPRPRDSTVYLYRV